MSARFYRITQGTFLDSDGAVKGVGQLIELPDDVAMRCLHQIDPTPVDPQQPAAGGDAAVQTSGQPQTPGDLA